MATSDTDDDVSLPPEESSGRVQRLKAACLLTLCDTAKFFYGFSFGILIWIILIEPYARYLPGFLPAYWAKAVFGLIVAFVFMSSQLVRVVMTLFLPSLVGNASQNFIVLLLLTSLFSTPVYNVAMNSVEAVRVIGCSLTMTFDHLRERAKLILNPLVEVLKGGGDKSSASIGVNLREIAKLSKFEYLKSFQASGGSGEKFNLTELLHRSCMSIFKETEVACSSVVGEWYESCKRTITPLLAMTFCYPVLRTLEAACPATMRLFTDKEAICNRLRMSEAHKVKLVNRGASGNNNLLSSSSLSDDALTFDQLFEAFNEQVAQLADQVATGSGEITSAPKRIELSVKFNEQTKNIIGKTQETWNFIMDKYKWRNFFINLLLLLYDLYTSYTFLMIFNEAYQYRRKYLEQIKFDNCYITGLFIELDNKLSAKNRLLPLTRDESERYIPTLTCRRRTKEERNYQKSSCLMIVLFLVVTLSFLYLDDIFASILDSIREHSLVYYKESGSHKFDIIVKGTGSIAQLARRLTNSLKSTYNLDRETSTQFCLPAARRTNSTFYLRFAGLICLYLTIDQISIYAMRFRRVTCAFFYTEKERLRIAYLHKLIAHQRKVAASNRYDETTENKDNKDDNDEDDDEDPETFTLRDAVSYLSECVSESVAGCRKRIGRCWLRRLPDELR